MIMQSIYPVNILPLECQVRSKWSPKLDLKEKEALTAEDTNSYYAKPLRPPQT